MESRERHWWTCLWSRKRDKDVENALADTVGKGTGVSWEGRTDRRNRWLVGRCRAPQGAQPSPRQPAGEALGGLGAASGGSAVCVLHIYAVWQKPTQHCKAFHLQLKINLKNIKKLNFLKKLRSLGLGLLTNIFNRKSDKLLSYQSLRTTILEVCGKHTQIQNVWVLHFGLTALERW